MTDWQQPFVTLLTQAEGTSVVHENRFGYAESLKKMGVDIELFQNCLGGKACRYANCGHTQSHRQGAYTAPRWRNQNS